MRHLRKCMPLRGYPSGRISIGKFCAKRKRKGMSPWRAFPFLFRAAFSCCRVGRLFSYGTDTSAASHGPVSQLQAGRKGRTSESRQQAPEGGAQALSAVDVQGNHTAGRQAGRSGHDGPEKSPFLTLAALACQFLHPLQGAVAEVGRQPDVLLLLQDLFQCRVLLFHLFSSSSFISRYSFFRIRCSFTLRLPSFRPVMLAISCRDFSSR